MKGVLRVRKLIERALGPIIARVEELGRKVDRLSALVEARIEDEASLARVAIGFNPAAAVGYRGDAFNFVYRGFVGDERPLSSAPSPVPFGSTLCRQVHFALDQYRFWTRALKERPKFLRKQWEFVYIAQALYERGMLAPGRRGLGFGVGREPLPALFASFGCEVVATDQSLDGAIRAGWARTNEHSVDLSGLNDRGICTERMFSALASFAEVDMNAIPPALDASFDFCWSSCSLEHLGSLANGAEFVKRAMKTLKPGGVAVHTTEFNLSSNDATFEDRDLSIYRRRDIEALCAELAAAGHKVGGIDFEPGQGFADMVVDLPPFGRGEPHLRLRLDQFDCTSIGLVVEKAAE
jgi:SAM-dependent methyltransferase